MKPKFALDLSHEGINLLHRSKGGWTLVGSVALDDPEIGTHLADIRRTAAELESGGFTCKIIIPNSQILYTTLEAPGPDDIAREVQIRSGLDGLTPYPVGELVFDWRGAGERARVAVLARDTMDEAEAFAVEHKFNPVSFVARSLQGEFSGEPFFGKTRAATKILGPTERVEPDASPVPRRPRALEPAPVVFAEAKTFGVTGQRPSAAPPTFSPVAPAAEDTPRTGAGGPPEPLEAPPVDDQFAELDAIAAELSGDPSAAAPAFRSQTARNRARSPGGGTDHPTPPPLAPFPPTSDDAEAKPSTRPQTRKPRGSGKATAHRTAAETEDASGPQGEAANAPTPASSARGGSASRRTGTEAAPPARNWTPPETSRRAALDGPAGDAPLPADDVTDTPSVSFSTRRAGNGTTATPPPTGHSTPPPKPAPGAEPAPTAAPPHARASARKAMSESDRRRADMADAMSRPLPGTPAKPETGPEPREKNPRSSEGDAGRKDGGFLAFGQRRTARKEGQAEAGSSMAELMRGAGSSEARISPDQNADEPDLLAPGVAAADTARAKARTQPTPSPDAGTAPAPAPAEPKPAAAPAGPAKEIPQSALDTRGAPADTPKTKPVKTSANPQPRPGLAGPASEAEALTVFGARRAEEKRGGRKYLGLVLTLLLLLFMAIIALWSSFFVDDGDTVLFNPSEDVATIPETGAAPTPGGPDAAPADTAPEALPDEAAAEAEPDTATPTETEAPPIPQVLTPEQAETRYGESQIWQRAPETLAEPRSPGLDIGEVAGPGALRSAPADAAEGGEAALPSAPGSGSERADPLPPPPADTIFELDENGLVNPSPEGTVSPTGIIVFQGPPEVVPPTRPTDLVPEPAEPDPVVPEPDATDATVPETVPEAVPEAGVPETGVPETPAAFPDLPDTRAPPRPGDAAGLDDASLDPVPELDAADATAVVATAAQGANPTATPETTSPELATADAAAIDAAVGAVAASFVNATELAVAASIKPTHRPNDFDQIVRAAIARAATAPAASAPTAPATTTPAIPTSASVATQATTSDALDLREINLLGISGPSNARRALVRMSNGRYITVKVGDRLDGGRVTSITDAGLTYQKGSRSYALQLLPLG